MTHAADTRSHQRRCLNLVLSCGRARSRAEPRINLLCRCPGVGDAVRDPDAAKAAAGHEQAGMLRQRAIDCGDSVEVPDLVLRVAALPAIDAREQRRAADAEQRTEGGE